jgi:hypothetical protein
MFATTAKPNPMPKANSKASPKPVGEHGEITHFQVV